MQLAMKILICVVVTFISPGLVCAGCNSYVWGSGGVACTEAANEVGVRDTLSTNQPLAADAAWCYLYAADCSGTLKTGYINVGVPAAATHMDVCVYSSAGSAATPNNANNILVGCATAISVAATGVQSGAVTGTPSVVAGTSYWVCGIIENAGANPTIKRTNTQTAYYKSGTGWYGAPPANLATTWGSFATTAPFQWYVTIGAP